MFSLTNNCDSTKTDQLQTIRTIYHIVYTTNTHTHTQTYREKGRKRERERNTHSQYLLSPRRPTTLLILPDTHTCS